MQNHIPRSLMVTVGALLILLGAWCILDYLQHQPSMSEAAVLRAAASTVDASGIDITDYSAPRARFEFPDRERTWTVIYTYKNTNLPFRVWVEIDDQTGRGRAAIIRPGHRMASVQL